MPANESYFRNLKTMHVVFALSSFAMFVATFWMMGADHADEWREIQTIADEVEELKLRKAIAAETETLDSGEIKKLIAKHEEDAKKAEDEQKKKKTADEIAAARTEVAKSQLKFAIKDRDVRFNRAERDKARADKDLAIRDELDAQEIARLQHNFKVRQAKVEELESELEELTTDRDRDKTLLNDLTKGADEAQAAISDLYAERDRLKQQLDMIAPESAGKSLKRTIMEWPIIDGFNSHHKIIQDWLPELPITLGMAHPARFDRCRTCHLMIDRVEAGDVAAFPFGLTGTDAPKDWVNEDKFPHPFATHPRPELYVTAASPHPLPTFGCTICHDGQGSGTSFQNASHSPDNPHQQHEWDKEHAYSYNHFWEYPMLPKRYQESSCLKCHHTVTELGVNKKFGPTAPKLYEGFELIKTFGCFGCHEIHGFDAGKTIGPDLRLEPNYSEIAVRLLTLMDLEQREVKDEPVLAEIRTLAESLIDNTGTEENRHQLMELILADKKSVDENKDKDPLLSPAAHGLAKALEDAKQPGSMRKVGPALNHIAQKTTKEWVAYWTEEPKRFRDTTRMPQFFGLTNQHDAVAKRLQPVELAGIAEYLFDKSTNIELKSPDLDPDNPPNAERGKTLFSRRGCLACHSHDAFPKITADFGPDLSKEHEKIRPGEDGFKWLYTWLRNPHAHHPRSKMPNLLLEPYEVKGEKEGEKDEIDPAADIAAFLLEKGSREFPDLKVDGKVLDVLVELYLSKTLTKSQRGKFYKDRKYPYSRERIKGDEIELLHGSGGEPSDDDWRRMKLNYVGRRTISRYGCYGCHSIPGFETARPIGTTLQDWARKDTSKLALEHIEEFLKDHGEPDGSPTDKRVSKAVKAMTGGGFTAREFASAEDEEREMATAYSYEHLLHHRREGFLWQKLRDPRSYDYEKIETKGYDERLRMPRFTFSRDPSENEKAIEAIATFVLGLVAEPPSAQYLYRPEGPAKAVIAGEGLLKKYNCVGCHIIDLPKIKYAEDLERFPFSQLDVKEHADGLRLLLQMKPPRNAVTGEKVKVTVDGEEQTLDIVEFHGMLTSRPDPDEDPEFQIWGFDNWEVLQVGDQRLFPGERITFPDAQRVELQPARGGRFAEWLVDELLESRVETQRSRAWQMSPPPLYLEGIKVQTPWLFGFLRNPIQLRETLVLRMPKFNMSPEEARALANYFAAYDGAAYPYQAIPEREPAYLSRKNTQLKAELKGAEYLPTAWDLLAMPAPKGLCIKCHSVGGMPYVGSGDVNEVQGPSLEHAAERLRPEWTLLWLYQPKWITPYTSMLAPFAANQTLYPDILNGDPQAQTIAVRDALMNYFRITEELARKKSKPTAPATGAGGQQP